MKTHDEMIWEWMQDPAFVAAYEALEEEFALFDERSLGRVGAVHEPPQRVIHPTPFPLAPLPNPSPMPYNPAIHHRRSIRLQNYDYSSAGAYSITIVVKDRACVLAEIVDGEIRLSEIGQAVQEAWESLPTRYPGVELDASVIMPNHTHGIIVITEAGAGVGAVHVGASVGAVHEPPLRQDRRRMLLPKIVGFFKMNSAKRANLLLEGSGGAFWQRDYYEHIIRDEADLERIRAYIIANPLRWENDQLHPPVGAVHEPPLR